METLALIIFVLLSLIGFAAIFFTTFGTLIILIGAFLYALLTGFTSLTVPGLLLVITLYLCGEVMEYLCVIIGAKKIGASNAAAAGAIAGGLAGALAGILLLGTGIVLSTFLGIFLGAFLVEYLVQRDLVRSLKAGAGGLLGRIGSIFAKVIIAAAMLAVVSFRIISG